MAPLCKFWQQGTCRNGNNCRFDHPPKTQGSSNNPFAPLQNQGSNPQNNFRTGGAGRGRADQGGPGPPFGLDRAAIITDLINERPQWILSAYGPGRLAPAQLFGGSVREQSFEEMRLLHYAGVSSGNPQQAVDDANKLFQASDQQMQKAAANVDDAIRFILDSEKDHPNRVDICSMSSNVEGGFPRPPPPRPNQESGINPFSATSQPAAISALGRPYAPTKLAFAGAFGQPSAMGPKPSPFASAGGGFGQPSQMGQKPSPFAPSNPTSTANPFSSFANNPSPFTQQSQMPASGGFGQPSSTPSGQANPFGATSGQTPFGQAPAAQSTPFGQSTAPPNPFHTPAAPVPGANPFGQTTPTPSNPFGQAAPAPANPFTSTGPAATSGANPFGANQANGFPPAPAQPVNSFTNQPSSSTGNPFSAPQSNPPTGNPFGTPPSGVPPQPDINGNSQNGSTSWIPHPDLKSYARLAPDGRKLAMFKGRHVEYHENDPGFRNSGRWNRIWCPEGLPSSRDTEMDESFYTPNIEAEYRYLRDTGSFQGGMMPIIPPKIEWCLYDF